jgi:poly(3-hydroxybutyrate) depolymerase
MNELIKQVESDQCLDRGHIFMTGFSMGGYFSNETACTNPLFRAAGPHSGGTHDLGSCKNMHRPMIIFHFKSDALIDYACGSGARDNWVKKNGCMAANPDVTPVKGGSCEYYKGCPPDGQVAFCSFDEPPGEAGETITGHAWSGGSSAMSGFAIPQTESATELGWAFFKKYAW